MMKANTQIPNEQALLTNLGKIAYTLDKTYLSRLDSDYGVLPFEEYFNKDGDVSHSANIRALEIERWVYDRDEKISDCFKNVMSVFTGSEETLAMVIHRTPRGVRMFFVTKNSGGGRNEDSKNDIGLLSDSICGNFPGTKTSVFNARETDLNKLFNFDAYKSIATLCNIPSEKSEEYLCQGIDKLLNGIVPKTDAESYFIVILAESLPQNTLRDILNGYHEMATAITPFAGYQFQAGENATKTEGEMEALSHSDSISHSITKTHSVNAGLQGGLSLDGIANIGASLGYGYSWGKTDTTGVTDTRTKGTNRSVSLGTSENTTYTYKSYIVTDLIAKLEATIKRINESQSTGLWKCASYVLAQEPKASKNIANFLRSLTQGDDSYIEPSFLNEWSKQENNGVTMFGEAIKYLTHFCHPVFVNGIDNVAITPTANVSTTELANVFAFPRYSVQGLPVIECTRFGREPHSLDKLILDIELGCGYHMYYCARKEEECKGCSLKNADKHRIKISKEELKKHTFITGSTGSGKSNTIYHLLSEVCLAKDSCTTFLIIEPAKGEYKDVFGGRDDVSVYGTNPFKAPNLLKINPFSFPRGIHVLEHIDRLVEVFNACWPMYAAMPAILKESIEKAYELVGWNLRTSKHIQEFPTFSTLMTILPKIIDSSGYSADTSNDYKGALLTRVRSLNTGMNGQIFEADTDYTKLFDENAIVDISRIGSSETKSLIMGIVVLKLQEYRMSELLEGNQPLRHITVLEEAHNLLRRTSSEQSQESSNLQGKSVEMLANAIAEMRTYGEGFIIVDQSPGLMDMSVIRNTNTKIIMRSPDESDRVLVGKAAGLSDAQIDELSRLKCGVAALSQSGWIEPVLCKVDEFTETKPLSERFGNEDFSWEDEDNSVLKKFLCVALDVEQTTITKEMVDIIRKWCVRIGVRDKVREVVENVLGGKKASEKVRTWLAGELLGIKLKDLPDKQSAILQTQNILINQFDFTEHDEIIRRVNALFTEYYPANIFSDPTAGVERWERRS